MFVKQDLLERVLFVVFVATTNAFVGINLVWALFTTTWNSIFLGVLPIISLAALASFLAFVLLEDRLGSRRAWADG